MRCPCRGPPFRMAPCGSGRRGAHNTADAEDRLRPRSNRYALWRLAHDNSESFHTSHSHHHTYWVSRAPILLAMHNMIRAWYLYTDMRYVCTRVPRALGVRARSCAIYFLTKPNFQAYNLHFFETTSFYMGRIVHKQPPRRAFFSTTCFLWEIFSSHMVCVLIDRVYLIIRN